VQQKGQRRQSFLHLRRVLIAFRDPFCLGSRVNQKPFPLRRVSALRQLRKQFLMMMRGEGGSLRDSSSAFRRRRDEFFERREHEKEMKIISRPRRRSEQNISPDTCSGSFLCAPLEKRHDEHLRSISRAFLCPPRAPRPALLIEQFFSSPRGPHNFREANQMRNFRAR
jgi:hypothetical protein